MLSSTNNPGIFKIGFPPPISWESPLLVVTIPTHPEGLAETTVQNLRHNERQLGIHYLYDMGEYLHNFGVALHTPTLKMPSHHRVEVTEGDTYSAMVRIARACDGRANNGLVSAVEPDVAFHINALPINLGSNFDLSSGSHATYVSDLQISTATANGIRGYGAKIAVIDTGIEPGIVPDSHFSDLLAPGPGTCIDSHGHGTAMAKIIQAIAPSTEIFVVRVTDSGHLRLWDVMAGVRTAVSAFASDIVNLSLGCRQVSRSCAICGGYAGNRSVIFEDYLRNIKENSSISGHPDPIIVAAAGNSGKDQLEFPAAYSTTLAVGAITSRKSRSSFSNYGTSNRALIMLPGGEWDDQQSVATEYVGKADDHGAATYCIGTSPAAAYASGVLALFREHLPGIGATTLLDRALRQCRQDIVNYSPAEHGLGRLVFELVTRSASP